MNQEQWKLFSTLFNNIEDEFWESEEVRRSLKHFSRKQIIEKLYYYPEIDSIVIPIMPGYSDVLDENVSEFFSKEELKVLSGRK